MNATATMQAPATEFCATFTDARLRAAARLVGAMSDQDALYVVAALLAAGRTTRDEIRQLAEQGRDESEARLREYRAGRIAGEGWAMVAAHPDVADRVSRLSRDSIEADPDVVLEAVVGTRLPEAARLGVWQAIGDVQQMPSRCWAAGFVAGVHEETHPEVKR